MVMFPARLVKEHAEKPLRGEPCNHCGLCCRVEACHASKELLKSDQAPCIALEVHDGKYMCGLLLRPEHYVNGLDYPLSNIREFVDYWVNPGVGCQMDDHIKLVQITVTKEAA